MKGESCANSNIATEQHSQRVIIGCVFVLLAAFGFFAKSILVKLAYGYSPQLDAITLMLLRMAISLSFFLFVAVRSNRPSKQTSEMHRMRAQDWLMIIALGFLGYYLSSLLYFEGLSIATSLSHCYLAILASFWFMPTSIWSQILVACLSVQHLLPAVQ